MARILLQERGVVASHDDLPGVGQGPEPLGELLNLPLLANGAAVPTRTRISPPGTCKVSVAPGVSLIHNGLELGKPPKVEP